MLSVEFLYAAAANAGLLTPATIASTEVLVDFRAPDVEVLGGMGLSSEYSIRYPASKLSLGLADQLEIAGDTYRVREVRIISDGSECRATLTRTS